MISVQDSERWAAPVMDDVDEETKGDEDELPDPGASFYSCLAFWTRVWLVEHEGKRLTSRLMAEWLTTHGHKVTKPYVANLRNGHARTPSLSLAGAIAAFFGVSLGEFFSMQRDDQEIPEMPPDPVAGSVVVTTDPQISSLALRATELDKQSLALVQKLMDRLGGIQDTTGRGNEVT